MGKGKRNSKYQEAYDMSGASAKAVKNNGKKKDMTTLWITLVIAVLLLGSILLYVFSSTGIVSRNTKLAYTDNYAVDANMITYYENQILNQTFYTYYQYYYQLTQDAESAYNFAQQYAANISYRESAIDIVKELLILCEGAKADGMTLDDEDVKTVDETMESIGSDISSTFGRGVMKSDIRKAVELQVLANKYYEKYTEQIEDSITSEELKAYMENNKANFYIADYLMAELSVLSDDYTDDKEGFAAAKALVDEYVAKFEKATTTDEFKTLLIEYTVKTEFDELVSTEIDSALRPDQTTLNAYEQDFINDIVKLIVGGETISLESDAEGELGEALATIKKTLSEKCKEAVEEAINTQSYVDADSETAEEVTWLISSDRASGDVKKVSVSDDTEYSYTVYMIDKVLYLNDEMSRSVGHILIEAKDGTATEEELAAAKQKAEEILAEYLAGEQTEEAFEELGWKNTDDSNVFYDNVVIGDMVDEFEDWLFDENRKEGDTGIVLTEYGYHVMLYRGEELLVDADAREGVTEDKYSEYLKANEGKVTIHSKYVTEDDAE